MYAHMVFLPYDIILCIIVEQEIINISTLIRRAVADV